MPRSSRTPLDVRFWAKVDKRGPDECWPWLASCRRDGYAQIAMGGRHGGAKAACRVAYHLATGADLYGDYVVMHTCDNPKCVNPAHLRAGTHADNVADKVAKGRGAVGFMLPQTKLSDDDVRSIRASTESQPKLAQFYRVSQSTISRIRTRKRCRRVLDV